MLQNKQARQDDRALDLALQAAHARSDKKMLIALYAAAAARRPEAAAYFLTHAYVYALESGARDAAPLRARLVALGAEV
ncbi:MAG: hypothetical protein AAGI09_08205 [Pseudomonadota bacterium]